MPWIPAPLESSSLNSMDARHRRSLLIWMISALCAAALARGAVAQSPAPAAGVLRVCADPNNLPQSNSRGEGYENKIAEALARDLGWKLEYTFFPQRMGFERNTLRNRDETTQQYRCDLIMGVPVGYDRAATTRPYMRSTYALIYPKGADLGELKRAADLLSLPDAKRRALRIGVFARTPASDWVLRHGLLDHAVLYPPQSGDPAETAQSIIEKGLAEHTIDAAILWGPIAGFLAGRHGGADTWLIAPFEPEPTIKFDYEISMGLRAGETEWKNRLDSWIGAHQPQITQILASYHVPLLELAESSAARQP